MAFKFSYCTIVMATLMLASSVMGATTVTASIKDKKVTFSGFGGVRKYSVKSKKSVTQKNHLAEAAVDSFSLLLLQLKSPRKPMPILPSALETLSSLIGTRRKHLTSTWRWVNSQIPSVLLRWLTVPSSGTLRSATRRRVPKLTKNLKKSRNTMLQATGIEAGGGHVMVSEILLICIFILN
jgi:hypothetical protein